jgi:co-chaperonin GroES (HSP10)
MQYDFNTTRLKDKIQINVDEWVQPESNLLQLYKMSGRSYLTYITQVKALDKSIPNLSHGDYVLLSKVACDIATSPTSPYELDDKRFYNIPLSQVVGKFKNNSLKLGELELFKGYVIYKKISRKENSVLSISDVNTTIGIILKTSKESVLKEGNVIMLRDNVSTPIRLESSEYFAAEERAIVGIFKDSENLSFSNLTIINENILMKPYVSKNLLNSSILETPDINYEDLDYSDVFNRDLFKVYYADKSLNSIKEGEILILNRDYTNYVYFNNEKYFIIDGKKWISGKIIERDN